MGGWPAVKNSLQRQHRLLAVRSLQADFAAAEVRRSQLAADQILGQVQQARLAARPDMAGILSGSSDVGLWLLSCAEQELAGIKIDLSMHALHEVDMQTESLQLQESQARQERDQIKKVCERLKGAAEYEEQIKEQAALDDLFSASFLLRQSRCESV